MFSDGYLFEKIVSHILMFLEEVYLNSWFN